MKHLLLIALALLPLPALAQHEDHGSHAGHHPMPMDHGTPTVVAPPPPEAHPHHDHMPSVAPVAPAAPSASTAPYPMMMDHGSHAQHAPAITASGVALPPAVPIDHAADTLFDPAAMARARATIRHEHGGMASSLIRIDLAELRIVNGRDGYRWDGEGWFGGDIDRFVLKSEGEGTFDRHAADIEVQALWGHAIGPNFDVQIGLRHDVSPNPSRTYLAAGIEGILPYWPELELTAFLSDKGDLTAEATISYDMRLTQRLILQPRLEAKFAAQNVPAQAIGAGLSEIDAGLRLRYHLRPEIAPYLGIGWTRKIGDTAKFARNAGDDPDQPAILIGLHAWF